MRGNLAHRKICRSSLYSRCISRLAIRTESKSVGRLRMACLAQLGVRTKRIGDNCHRAREAVLHLLDDPEITCRKQELLHATRVTAQVQRRSASRRPCSLTLMVARYESSRSPTLPVESLPSTALQLSEVRDDRRTV